MDVLEVVIVARSELIYHTCTRHNSHPACVAVLFKSLETYDIDLTAGLLLERKNKTLYGDVLGIPEAHMACKIDLALGINAVGIDRGVRVFCVKLHRFLGDIRAGSDDYNAVLA